MSAEGEAPRRLRAGDVIDAQQAALMAALTRSRSGGSVKCSLSLNAKGDVQGGLETSAELGTDVPELQTLLAQVVNITKAEFRRMIEEAKG